MQNFLDSEQTPEELDAHLSKIRLKTDNKLIQVSSDESVMAVVAICSMLYKEVQQLVMSSSLMFKADTDKTVEHINQNIIPSVSALAFQAIIAGAVAAEESLTADLGPSHPTIKQMYSFFKRAQRNLDEGMSMIDSTKEAAELSFGECREFKDRIVTTTNELFNKTSGSN